MQTLAATARFSLAALIAALLTLSVAHADEAQSADDGWRRTALGWERTQAWTEPTNSGRPRDRFLFADEHRQATDRWDFHPAVLVGLQLVAVTLGWAIWSQSTSTAKGAANSLRLSGDRRKAA